MWNSYIKIWLSCLSICYCSSLLGSIEELKSLIVAKKYDEAYGLAQASMTDAGDPQYDYLLGLSAIESDHLPEAIFALERVSMSNPGNVRARFDLGRAYFKLRHYDLSRETFEIVLSSSPDESLKNWTQHYLQLIESGKKLQHPLQLQLHASLAPGFSSNINTGPDLEFTTIPVPNGVRPGEVPVKVPDGFVHADVFAELRYRWNDRSSLRTKLWADYRKNFQSPTYDYQNVGLDASVDFQKGQWRFKVPVNANLLFVNYETYRWVFDGGLRIGFDVNKENRLSVSGVFDFRYFPFDPSLNATDLRMSLNWEGWFKNFQSVLSLYSNWAFPLFQPQAYLSKDFYGAKAIGIYHFGLNHEIVGALMGERAIYKDINIQYTVARADWLINAFFAWRWKFASDFSLQPSYSLVKTFSNIIEYEHLRHELQCAISWDFSL